MPLFGDDFRKVS